MKNLVENEATQEFNLLSDMRLNIFWTFITTSSSTCYARTSDTQYFLCSYKRHPVKKTKEQETQAMHTLRHHTVENLGIIC